MTAWVRDQLAQGIEEDAAGQQRLTFTLPDRDALHRLAQTMAGLLLAGGAPPLPPGSTPT